MKVMARVTSAPVASTVAVADGTVTVRSAATDEDGRETVKSAEDCYHLESAHGRGGYTFRCHDIPVEQP